MVLLSEHTVSGAILAEKQIVRRLHRVEGRHTSATHCQLLFRPFITRLNAETHTQPKLRTSYESPYTEEVSSRLDFSLSPSLSLSHAQTRNAERYSAVQKLAPNVFWHLWNHTSEPHRVKLTA